jgi:alanine racemase
VRYSSSEAVRVHLKVDTGLGRLGILPRDTAAVARMLSSRPEVELEGLMTHFACADSGDSESIAHQLDVFGEVTTALETLGHSPKVRHAANSAALLQSERARLDLVRPGIALFGVEPSQGLCDELRAVMRVSTQIIALRELAPKQSVGYGATWTASRRSTIATIPMGYADGLSRSLSNRGHVLVRGARAPIVGTISMDLTMIDVTDVPGAALGDECVVLGTQKGPLGDGAITATELATHTGTIPWEVLTAVSRRVPRFYREP